MEKALLDTDIYSEILRAKNLRIVENAEAYRAEHGIYSLSAATVVELVKGLQQAGRSARLGELIPALEAEDVVPIDRDAAVVAGQIYGELDRTGQTIGRADPMIAGVAIHRSLVLVTGNTQHFQRIQRLGFDLKLADWRL